MYNDDFGVIFLVFVDIFMVIVMGIIVIIMIRGVICKYSFVS